MNKIISSLAAIALTATVVHGQSASVASTPTGMITCTLPHASTSFLSLPLSNNAAYTSTVSAVTANTISVADSPAPFTSNLATSTTPYFVKFLSGAQQGRVVLITANTTTSLTLDTTDNSTQTVPLNTTNFSVAAGDEFEIIPAATLASVFGDGSSAHPLSVASSTSPLTADTVGLFSPVTGRWKAYYFNATAGYWETVGSSVSANATVVYPNAAMSVTRRDPQNNGSVTLAGVVTTVPALIKSAGNSSPVFSSTGYATDVTLSQLQFGSSWVKGNSPLTANTVSLWNPAISRFVTYYQKTDGTWRTTSDATTDQSSTVVSAGTAISLLQRSVVSGSSSYLTMAMPYSL